MGRAHRHWCDKWVYARFPRQQEERLPNGDADLNVSAGHTSWRLMAVLGGRACENPQDFREERGVQVPLLAFRPLPSFICQAVGRSVRVFGVFRPGAPAPPAGCGASA
jgi:hypothetical protein